MKRETERPTRGDKIAILVFVIFSALATAVLWPVFAKVDHTPIGVVQDGLGRPMSGLVLRFRDSGGRLVDTVTTDDKGEFRRLKLDYPSRGTTADGFGLTRQQIFTGGINRYYFSPIGPLVAFVHDPSGVPVANVNVDFEPTDSMIATQVDAPELSSDQAGIAQTLAPVGGRYDVSCWSPEWTTATESTTASANGIRYDFTEIPADVITGKLLTPGNAYNGGYEMLAVGAGSSMEANTEVDEAGQFQFTGLPPGTYHLAVGSGEFYNPKDLFTRPFTVASGQAINVTLRYTEVHGAGTASLDHD